MNGGLDISEDEFIGLKVKEQNLILFRNIVFVRKQFKDYRYWKKVWNTWLGILSTVFLTWLGIKNFVFGE